MEQHRIIYGNDDEQSNKDYADKGYRDDVIVILNNKKYKLYIIEPIRLSQDFISEIIDYDYYQMNPNIVIVKEITKSEIEKTVEELINLEFFDNLGYVFNSKKNENTMENIRVAFDENICDGDKERIINGRRVDVQVTIESKIYNVYIVTMMRIFQDFIRDNVFKTFKYLNQPNLILVKKITNEEILKVIKKLYNIGFFCKLGQMIE